MENYDDIKDTEFYSELQGTLRSYDTKLWQIPGLFFAVIGLIITSVNFKDINSIRVGVILFTASFFFLILILLYNKAHIFHISIQKKINEFDNKFNNLKINNKISKIIRMPLTSMTPDEFKLRVNELEKRYLEDPKSNKGAYFDPIQKFLADERVSSWIRNIMLIIFVITFFSSIFILFPYLLDFICPTRN